MKFEEIFFENNLIGFEARLNGLLFFHGTRFGSLELLQKVYPDLRFVGLKQVHGNTLVESTAVHATSPLEGRLEADAHWATEEHLALLIATADCLPVLLGYSSGAICAIHAGWRGIENEIVPKAIRQLQPQFGAPQFILVGPHIQQESFEVDIALAEKLDQIFLKSKGEEPSLVRESTFYISPSRTEKAYTSLKQILAAQVQTFCLSGTQSFELPADTVQNNKFASFRRDKGQSERNLSFIAKIS